MPRSLWNGTIAFGQVNVPVKLYSAVQSKTASFREVHLADGARIEHRRFCTAEDEEIPYAEVVKGFVEHFVPVGDIDHSGPRPDPSHECLLAHRRSSYRRSGYPVIRSPGRQGRSKD